jgi:Mor family transcriptional regulator
VECLCCNPTHLKFGTHLENSVDALEHGTVKFAKLNADKVREIRKLSDLKNNREKQAKVKELSEKYNVGIETIYNVLKKRTWKHVE